MENVLYGDIEELKRIREEIKAYEDVKTKLAGATLTKEKYEKDIRAEEKLLSDTIDATIRKRREQVVGNFDKQIKEAQDRLKKVRNKRDKAKTQGMEARIKAETAELEQENKTLREEIKTYMRQKKVSSVFNGNFLYGLFFPGNLTDILRLIIIALIFVAAIPTVVVTLIHLHPILEVLIFIAIAAIVPAIYVALYKYCRIDNKQAFMEKREQRLKINKNRAQIKRIKKGIKKDKNESGYNLEGFDSDISEIEAGINDIVTKKNNVLGEFDSVTKIEITDEIIRREQPRIDELKAKLNEASIEVREYNDTQKNMSMNLTSKYGAYMGAENINMTRINALIDIMNEGRAKTIGDALNIYNAAK